MSLKRGSVLGLVLCLVLVGTIEAQAQGNTREHHHRATTTSSFDYDWGGLSALRTFVNALIAQVEQSKQKIAQLEAALNAEISARQAADVVLQNTINAISGGGVTQAALDAAIARSCARQRLIAEAMRGRPPMRLEGQIATRPQPARLPTRRSRR